LPVLNLRDFLERKSPTQQKKKTETYLRRAIVLAKYAAKFMLGIAKKNLRWVTRSARTETAFLTISGIRVGARMSLRLGPVPFIRE
jgi:hypothetical protein